MKQGYHTWPDDPNPHPVGTVHKKKKPMAYDNINNLMSLLDILDKGK